MGRQQRLVARLHQVETGLLLGCVKQPIGLIRLSCIGDYQEWTMQIIDKLIWLEGRVGEDNIVWCCMITNPPCRSFKSLIGKNCSWCLSTTGKGKHCHAED